MIFSLLLIKFGQVFLFEVLYPSIIARGKRECRGIWVVLWNILRTIYWQCQKKTFNTKVSSKSVVSSHWMFILYLKLQSKLTLFIDHLFDELQNLMDFHFSLKWRKTNCLFPHFMHIYADELRTTRETNILNFQKMKSICWKIWTGCTKLNSIFMELLKIRKEKKYVCNLCWRQICSC